MITIDIDLSLGYTSFVSSLLRAPEVYDIQLTVICLYVIMCMNKFSLNIIYYIMIEIRMLCSCNNNFIELFLNRIFFLYFLGKSIKSILTVFLLKSIQHKLKIDTCCC